MMLTRTDRHGITEYMALTLPPRSRIRLKLYPARRKQAARQEPDLDLECRLARAAMRRNNYKVCFR